MQGLVEDGQTVGDVVVVVVVVAVVGSTGCKSWWSSRWWRGGGGGGDRPSLFRGFREGCAAGWAKEE